MSAVTLLWLTKTFKYVLTYWPFTYTPWYVSNDGTIVQNSSGAHVPKVAEFASETITYI